MRSAHLLVVLAGGAVAVAAMGCVDSDNNPQILPAEIPAIVPSQGNIELSETVLDWGFVECGKTAAPKTYRVKNAGGQAISYTLSVEGSAFSIEGTKSGSLEPGAETVVSVLASVEGGAARVPFEGALLVDSPGAARPNVRIPLKITPDGAVLKVTPAVVAFGEVNVGQLATPIEVEIENTGFVPVDVSFQVPTGDELGLAWTNVPSAIPLGATVKKTLSATFAPKSEGVKTFESAITVVGPVCGAAPKKLKLEGTGVVKPVTVGPSPLDFGTVDCGTQALSKKVTITNDNAFSISWTAALTQGASSPFTVTPVSGAVAPGATLDVTVAPKSMTAPRVLTTNAYGDTLTITTDAAGDQPHVVDLQQSARGAILSRTVNSVFGAQTVGTTTNRTLTISNTGNAAGSVRMAVAAPFTVSPATPTALAIPAGQSANGTLSYTPTAASSSSSNVTYTVVGPHCGVALAQSPVTGNGVIPDYSATGAFTAFSVQCGATPAGQTITVRNDATALGQLLVTQITTTGKFTVSPATLGAIAAGGSATLTVTPNAAVIGTDRGGTSDTGTLTFKTNDPAFANVSYALTRGVHGANLRYVQNVGSAVPLFVPITTLDFPGCPNQTPVGATFYVQNNGDQDVAAVNGLTGPEWEFATTAGLSTFGVVTGGVQHLQGSYKGPNTASRPAVTVVPLTVPAAVTNVCIPPGNLSVTYTLLPASDSRCVIIL